MSIRSTLAGQAYEELRTAIVRGGLRPGAVLQEADLARSLGASRTPVREALLRIELEGYASRDDRGRLLVRDSTPSEFCDWFTVRKLMEEYAVGLASQRISDRELREMETLVAADGIALREGRVDRLATLNEQIHDLIFRASRNRGLIDLVRRLRGRVYGMSAFAVGGVEEQRAFVEEHAELARLLKEGSAELAVRIVGRHLDRARSLLTQGLEPSQGAGGRDSGLDQRRA